MGPGSPQNSAPGPAGVDLSPRNSGISRTCIDGRSRCHVDRPLELSAPDRIREHPAGSDLEQPCVAGELRRPQARNGTWSKLRFAAADRSGASFTRPLRPSRRRNDPAHSRAASARAIHRAHRRRRLAPCSRCTGRASAWTLRTAICGSSTSRRPRSSRARTTGSRRSRRSG